MQIAAQQLHTHLQKGLKNLYLLHGDEPLLQQEALDAIRSTARAQGFSERNGHTVSGAHFDWGVVLAAASSLSLFADKQILEIRIPSGKPGKDGSVALQQFAQNAQGNDTLLTIVILPRMDKLSKSSAWFSALDGAGISLEVQPIERKALPQWLAQRLALHGLRVESGQAGQQTLEFFADCIEGNLLAAHQEIEKLALLFPASHNAGVLSYAQVESAVFNVARYDIFKLSEAVLAGNAERVQRMLDGLQAQGEAEVLVHYTLAEDIRALKRVKNALAQGRPMPMALRESRIWGNKERLFERVLPRLDETALAQLVQSAHVVDGIVKGIKQASWPATGWAALRQLALQLCTLCSATAVARMRS